MSVEEFTVLNPADRNLPFSPSVGRNLVSVLPTSSCSAIKHELFILLVGQRGSPRQIPLLGPSPTRSITELA